MATAKIEQQICQAVQTIVDKKIQKAAFDKTISAIVVKCVNAAAGQYLISYQNGQFTAYGNPSSASMFQPGTLIEVLIPNGDFGAKKIILSTTAKTGYDTTVTATVVSCIDAIAGRYSVIYNGTTFQAFADKSESALYEDGQQVQILIPCGDVSQKKIILSAINLIGESGLQPITSIMINSDTSYTVFTNAGIERYNAELQE